VIFRKPKVWITSDLHFYHDKIIEYCGRPKDYQEKIIKGFEVIEDKDILICLGDVSWGRQVEFARDVLTKVKGKKILTIGNHDDSKPFMYYLHNGWDFACESFSLDYMGKKIIFSHKPMFWDGTWEINIHGHFHNNLNPQYYSKCAENYCKLIALEYLDYQPVLLENVLTKKSPYYKKKE